jgi:hypothetical protein
LHRGDKPAPPFRKAWFRYQLANESQDKTRERAAMAREMASGNKEKVPGKKNSAEQLRKMADAGESLRDLREVAGLTLSDLTTALKVKDKSFLEALEDGKEAAEDKE